MGDGGNLNAGILSASHGEGKCDSMLKQLNSTIEKKMAQLDKVENMLSTTVNEIIYANFLLGGILVVSTFAKIDMLVQVAFLVISVLGTFLSLKSRQVNSLEQSLTPTVELPAQYIVTDAVQKKNSRRKPQICLDEQKDSEEEDTEIPLASKLSPRSIASAASNVPVASTANGVDGIVIRTTQEHDAVCRLRDRLVDIADKCTERPLDMSDCCLIRFVRARKLNVDAAEAMYRKAHLWRTTQKPERIFEEYENMLATDTVPEMINYCTGGWRGVDKEGSPVYIDPIGQLDIKGFISRCTAAHMRYIVTWRHEKMTQLMKESEKKTGKPQYQIVVITDLTGLGMKHFNRAAFQMLRSSSMLEDTYYPERLKVCHVVNAPRIFGFFWKAVKGFFDEGTREKIQIHQDGATDILLGLVGKENLPTFLGGEYELKTENKLEIKMGGKVPNQVPPVHLPSEIENEP